MFEKIPVPVKGQPARASWGAGITNRVNELCAMAPARGLARDGLTGTGFAALPKNGRDRKTAPLHPWKVFAVGKSEDVDHCFEIYVPEGAVNLGENTIDVSGLTPFGSEPDRYTLDCEGDIDGNAVIYVAIVKDYESSPWDAKVVASLDEISDAFKVLAVLPLASLSIDDSGEYERGKVDAQFAHSCISLPAEGEDEASTPSPFRLVTSSRTDPDSGEQVSVVTVSDCYFYHEGELQTLVNYEVPAATLASGTVYLVGTKGASSGGDSWTWEVTDTPGGTSQDETINLKLYDFDDKKVTMDYRTTFLTVGGGSKEPEDKSCYRLDRNAQGEITGFANCYFMCGGLLYEGPTAALQGGIAALSIPCQGDSDPSGATIEFYAGITALKTAMRDLTKYTIPLYEFSVSDAGVVSVVTDFRTMPNASMGEVGL